MRVFFSSLLIFFFFSLCAQNHRCSAEDYPRSILKSPDKIAAYQTRIIDEEYLLQNSAQVRTDETILIPVAIHFQNLNETSDFHCFRELAIDQIAELNLHFQGLHEDSFRWAQDSSYFPEIDQGKSKIQFLLATKNHPQGYQLLEGEEAITFNQVMGDTANHWINYLNVFVRSADYLGLAPFGGTGKGDGIYLDYSAFGLGEGCNPVSIEAPFNQGKTLVHEISHYFFLNHIWGKRGCEHDDGVLDTPLSIKPNYDCPDSLTESCNSLDLHFNFMDYVDDDCMYMFTKGQVTRMEHYIKRNLYEMVDLAFEVCEVDSIDLYSEIALPVDEEVLIEEEELIESEILCLAPVDISSLQDNDHFILTWKGNEQSIFYEVRYRRLGSTVWKENWTIKDTLILTDLVVGEEYEWEVRAKCNTDYTMWLADTFSIRKSTEDDQVLYTNLKINSYPNPFGEKLIIQGKYADFLEDYIVKISFYNYYGNLIDYQKTTVAFGFNYFEVSFDTSNLPTGFYIIQCEFDHVKKRVKVFKTDIQ